MDRIKLISALVIIVISLPYFYFYNANQGYWWDEGVYLGLAKNIVEVGGYYISKTPDSFRPPFFPYMLALTWSVTGENLLVFKALPVLFAVLSLIVVYCFGRDFFGKETGLLAATLLATSPLFLFYSERILSESLFVLIATLALYSLFSAGKQRKYCLVSGVLIGLAFLTRYAGILLLPVYILYPFLWRKKFDRYFIAGLILFLLTIAPWFYMNFTIYGSPTGAIPEAAKTLGPEWYSGPWEFYFLNWIGIFGFAGLLVVPGLVYLVVKKKGEHSLLLLFALSMIFFMAIERKEARYLIHFYSLYFLIMALGFVKLKEFFYIKNWHRKFFAIGVYVIAILLVLSNTITALQDMYNGIPGGEGLKEAGLSLKNLGVERILSNNIPVLYYLTGAEIIDFPENSFPSFVTEKNIDYIVLELNEPTYPSYVWDSDGRKPSEVFGQFKLVGTFEEFGRTVVWVYKV